MGEVHTFTARTDSPARRPLSTGETWAILAQAMRASAILSGRVAAAIEAGAPPAECLTAVARLDEQNVAAGRIIASLLAAEVAANDAPGAA